MSATQTRRMTAPPAADPTAIPALVASKDAAKVQAIIRERYGFEASLQYCQHLIAFVEELTRVSRR